MNAVTSFFLEMVGSLVPALRVAALEYEGCGRVAFEYEAPAEVAVARWVAFEYGVPVEVAASQSVAFGPKHSCDIPELYLCY